ncbi:hypothetical protein [Shinella sp. G-2]|uniref:hypothetical protein n=1 Tax=Shinella sp. G-2 TaxID=3133141 RepID=UPI003D073278
MDARGTDHNTMARVRGFRDAHAQEGIAVNEALVQTCGYAPEKVENALRRLAERASDPPRKAQSNSLGTVFATQQGNETGTDMVDMRMHEARALLEGALLA